MNRSLVFGIPSSAAPSPEILLYRNQQNVKAAHKMADSIALSPYTKVILTHIARCVSREDMVLPPSKYYTCILTLEDLPRSNQQKEIEEAIKRVSTNIICYGSTDVRRDSAALWALCDLMQDLSNGKIIKADDKNVTDYLLCCLKCCHIPCAIAHPSRKAALAGDAETNKANQQNLNLAMFELGFTDANNPAIKKTLASLMAGTGVVPVEDIVEQLVALGIKKNESVALLLKALSQNTLGTYYPVQLTWAEFPFGTGTGGSKAGLGAEAEKKEPPKTNTEKVQDAFVNALPGLLDNVNSLTKQYGEAKIKEMTSAFDEKLKAAMSQATGQSASSISQEQLDAFAAQNAELVKTALASAAAKANVELPKKDNTLLYVGIGAGALVFTGLLLVLATRK